MWVITALGISGMGMFLERALHLHRARIDESDFLQGIFNNLRHGNVSEAVSLCEDTPGPVARLTLIAVKRMGTLSRDEMIEELDQEGRAEVSRMERRLASISLIAQISPLLGLLGTVVGILKAIMTLETESPMVLPADIAAGLSTGCITTVAGLLVTILCFLGFHVLVVKIDRLVLDMRHACSELLLFLFVRAPGAERESGEVADAANPAVAEARK